MLPNGFTFPLGAYAQRCKYEFLWVKTSKDLSELWELRGLYYIFGFLLINGFPQVIV